MSFADMKLLAVQPRTDLDAVGKRRLRLTNQIKKQIAMLEDHTLGKKRRGAWYVEQPDGSLIISVRYGKQDLELAKGKHAIDCRAPEECIVALKQALLVVLKGTFDDQLAKISTQIRARFKKAK
ncbi:hypothetical protein [Rhizobium sp. PL01]|uniref:hypothetical protein n=1 Tax=Rhizobium sp. PL01 TaxID=3085631 RepID=UPI0029811F20|nr:hypothetical protein [Rhizobium sp. PL01]MDW5316430.1 hypothetical protein [Rhizobium sp. PL01]